MSDYIELPERPRPAVERCISGMPKRHEYIRIAKQPIHDFGEEPSVFAEIMLKNLNF